MDTIFMSRRTCLFALRSASQARRNIGCRTPFTKPSQTRLLLLIPTIPKDRISFGIQGVRDGSILRKRVRPHDAIG
jgi:hypothetical protein